MRGNAGIKSAIWCREIPAITSAIREDLREQTVYGLELAVLQDKSNRKYALLAQFVQMVSVQNEAVKILQSANIPCAVIKGTASGINYPVPYLRTYGDIDILVKPPHYEQSIQTLRNQGFIQEGDIGKAETHLYRNGWLIELHQCPPDLERVKEGDYIRQYILSGLDDIQIGEISQPKCTFPMLPWKQNGRKRSVFRV